MEGDLIAREEYKQCPLCLGVINGLDERYAFGFHSSCYKQARALYAKTKLNGFESAFRKRFPNCAWSNLKNILTLLG